MKALTVLLILYCLNSSSKAQSVVEILTSEQIEALPTVEQYKQFKGMVGTYGECVMACRAIRINPNMTFDSYLSGDLWPTIRLKGGLKFIGKSMVLANSTQQPTGFPIVIESLEGDGKVFMVHVYDVLKSKYPGVRIRGKSNGIPFDIETDESGIAKIPPCDQFTYLFPWLKQSWEHKISPGTNRFVIRISEDQMHPEYFVINEKWVVKKNGLYFVQEDGKTLQFELPRVEIRKEREFFSDK